MGDHYDDRVGYREVGVFCEGKEYERHIPKAICDHERSNSGRAQASRLGPATASRPKPVSALPCSGRSSMVSTLHQTTSFSESKSRSNARASHSQPATRPV